MPKCRYCGKEIIYVQNLSTGRLTPCDPQLVEFRQIQSSSDTYDVFANIENGRLVRGRKPKPGERITKGYVPHKFTCEEKEIVRKERKTRTETKL